MEKSRLIDWFGEEWYDILKDYLHSEEFNFLGATIAKARRSQSVLPPKNDRDILFKAFKDIQPSQIKVVILGQDPHPKKGEYDGYAFSNNRMNRAEPTLINIIKAVDEQFPEHIDTITHGHLDLLDLGRWVDQGVLLTNTALTTIEKKPNCHALLWQPFTHKWIEALSEYNKDIAWVLWGNYGMNYNFLIKHGLLIYEEHPGSLNTINPFKGKSFKDVNEFLINTNRKEIIW